MNSIDLNNTLSLMNDKSFREELKKDPVANIHKLGYAEEENVNYKVHENTDKTFYCVMPHNNGGDLSVSQLGGISGGGAFTVSTAGSVGCLCTTISTAGSAGSAMVVNGKVVS